jgi:branched-chain amino acid transport system substrate-binding protein
MRPEWPRRLFAGAAAALTAVAAVVAGCGGAGRPFRIGVISDCVGYYRSLNAAEVSGAELPLIERGARRLDREPGGTISAANVAGRRVEIVHGCTEVLEFSTLTTEVRRLIEREHVDAIVAAAMGADEVALRDVASRYPHVAFFPVVHGPREVTMRHPAPNLFRVVGDDDQGAAGLGTYAYRTLGWRRAAMVVASWAPGWGERDAFMAEFCALGGRIVKQVSPIGAFEPSGKDAAGVPRDVDGVAIFAMPFFAPAPLIQRVVDSRDEPARSIVVGAAVADDPTLRSALGHTLTGVTANSFVDPTRLRAYRRAYANAFPGAPLDIATSELVTGYRDAVESLMRGLSAAQGDRRRLMPALGRLRVDLLGGPVRLDAHHQAIVSARLVRLPGDPQSAPRVLQTIPGVDESVGGLIAPSNSPAYGPPSCTPSAKRPPWAR